MKRRDTILIIGILMLLIIPFTSANVFSNFWGKVTGEATSGSTSLNITVTSNPPEIPYVQPISAQTPTEGGKTSVTFKFTAHDGNGVSYLDTATASAYFKNGGTTRGNTSCVASGTSGNDENFTCTIEMWYFDSSGSWTVNASIKDTLGHYVGNTSTTFTYNQLKAMQISPTSLTWPAISLSSTNVASSSNPVIVNNTGNDASANINVTAVNLQGETTKTQYIYANNFTIDNVTTGCSGTAMVNATSLKVANAKLYSGNNSLDYNNKTSGQEPLYFCLKGIPQDASSQSYSTTAFGPWTVTMI